MKVDPHCFTSVLFDLLINFLDETLVLRGEEHLGNLAHRVTVLSVFCPFLRVDSPRFDAKLKGLAKFHAIS